MPEYFRKGFGQEICDHLIDHAIATMAIQELVAVADCRNVASVKILKRSLLEFEKENKNEEGATDLLFRWKKE